jgi:hypothetical protein
LEISKIAEVAGHHHQVVRGCNCGDLPVGDGKAVASACRLQLSALLLMPERCPAVIRKNQQSRLQQTIEIRGQALSFLLAVKRWTP